MLNVLVTMRFEEAQLERLRKVSPAGSWLWRKYSRPETGKNSAGCSACGTRAPVTTQLWARTVLARLGQRAVYSWKVQVPQTPGLVRCTLVSSPAQTR